MGRSCKRVTLAANRGQERDEYAARQIKQAIVGYGAAEKIQVQHMVKQVLSIQGKIASDAADALAIAICHANHREWKLRKLS